MHELFFVAIIFTFAAILIAAGYWFVLQRVARWADITFWEAFHSIFRPDLERSKLTHGVVNYVYKQKMRGSAKKGPNNEVVEVKLLELRVPEDDFRFIQDNGGIPEFTRQLSDFRDKLAVRKGWAEPTSDPVAVHLTMDSRLKRLNPTLIRKYVDESHTRNIADIAGPGNTSPYDASKAMVKYGRATWDLDSAGSPYTFGRNTDNSIRTNFGQISGRHGEFRFEAGRWVLVPLKTRNPTEVNGREIATPTPLQHGDVITVGDSDPIHFSVVFNAAARSRTTDPILPRNS